MKKLISLTLALIMLFAVAAPTLSAAAEAEEAYITVYVEGFGNALYKNNVPTDENKIYPTGVDVGAAIKQALEPCLIELAAGMITGNYDRYCDELYNAVAPIYEELRLDENGEASDGSGWGGDMLTKSLNVSYTSGYKYGRLVFDYDWRLSAEYNAEILEKYIDRICNEKNVEKVNLLGRCLGGNVVSAYLQNGKNLDKVNDVCLYAGSTAGISAIGALFSGNIVLDDDAVEAFAENFVNKGELFEDPMMQSLITAFIDLFNYAKVLGIGTDALMEIVNNVKDNIIPRLVRDTYGSFPSFWSMCTDEYFDQAIALCYGTDELKTEYAGTIEKLVSFNNNVQKNAENRMIELRKQGIDIMIIAKYNIPNLPLSKDGVAQADGFTEVKNASFGATCADYGKVLSDSYISALSQEDKLYLSPDHKIDASTCLFPEKTWFFKNNTHADFNDCFDPMIDAFFLAADATVFTNELYPQFIDFDDETDTISPVEGLDPAEPEKGTNEERFSVLMRFLTAIFNFFSKLFKGEFDFKIGL